MLSSLDPMYALGLVIMFGISGVGTPPTTGIDTAGLNLLGVVFFQPVVNAVPTL